VREYDLIAEWYASVRNDTTGVPEATALASLLPRRSRVLDIGCGNGIPITKALMGGEHRVVSLDSSGAMLRHFRLNYPGMPAVQATVQSCPFLDSIFDAAVACGIMFHLNPEDQIRAIANVSRVLKPGALFLFTSGDEDCFQGKVSTMNGVEFRHFSYSIGRYERLLRDHGFTLDKVHADNGNNTYYLAKKANSPR